MHLSKSLLIALFSLCLMAGVVHAEDVRVRVRLIEADQGRGASDESLNQLLPHLKNFPYRRYKQIGSRTASLSTGKKQWMQLGEGHSMQIRMLGMEGDRARLEVTWRRDDVQLAKITVLSSKDTPFILGGDQSKRSAMIAVILREK